MITLKNRKVKIYIALFLLPALIVYLLFQIVPLILAFYFSLVEWNGISGAALKFVGLKNYIDAFHNADFLLSIKNMVKMVFFSVLFHTPIALLTAVAINTRCKGYRAFKALFFCTYGFSVNFRGFDVVLCIHAYRFPECVVKEHRSGRPGGSLAGGSCNRNEYHCIC